MITYISIFITAIFVNNIVLAQFLGICPFLGVSKKVSTATGMGAAVAFVMTLATICTYLLQKYLLDAFGIGFMQTIVFILVIAALVQMVEIIIKKVSPPLYQALGVFLPLITTNCTILGVAILVIQKNTTCSNRLFLLSLLLWGSCLLWCFFARYSRTVGNNTTTQSHARDSIALVVARSFGSRIYGICPVSK